MQSTVNDCTLLLRELVDKIKGRSKIQTYISLSYSPDQHDPFHFYPRRMFIIDLDKRLGSKTKTVSLDIQKEHS